jgi:prolyl-tRNA synthetase
MRQSQYFLKTSKTTSAEDVSINARLLEQGGFIAKNMAGVYTFLPLGYRVLAKIENIIREEMDAIGAGELLMPALHPKEYWVQTKRWDSVDVLFKIKSQHGYEYALGPTHEEVVTPISLPVIQSYKDLPLAVYQIQTKFRDEPRARSGLLRGREFRMKDLYSFHASVTDLERYYDIVAGAYHKIFQRMGLDAIYTYASGGTFSQFSHEFQVELPSGEDTIYINEATGEAKNKEIFSEEDRASGKYRETMACEVGNIFNLGTKFSESFDLKFTDSDGTVKPVIMASYGIGPSRVMGVIVEKFNDDKGIIWPTAVAPFQVHLVAIAGKNTSEVMSEADQLYRVLQEQGIEVLYDDRTDKTAGEKFADSDLLGLPQRIVVSAKTLAESSVELKQRGGSETKMVKREQLENARSII